MDKLHEKCLRCGRKLRSEESKLLGYGPTCWEKYNSDIPYKELFKIEEAYGRDNIDLGGNLSNK